MREVGAIQYNKRDGGVQPIKPHNYSGLGKMQAIVACTEGAFGIMYTTNFNDPSIWVAADPVGWPAPRIGMLAMKVSR